MKWALMCERLDLDVWEVIEAAATKPYGFMKFLPGPGLGGHCIPVDPSYLSWKLKSLNFSARFIELATEINSGMPEHVADRIAELLNEDRLAVNGSRILILGVAYKKDVGDMRESPAIDVIGTLARRGAEIAYHDPYVDECEIDGVLYKNSDFDRRSHRRCRYRRHPDRSHNRRLCPAGGKGKAYLRFPQRDPGADRSSGEDHEALTGVSPFGAKGASPPGADS